MPRPLKPSVRLSSDNVTHPMVLKLATMLGEDPVKAFGHVARVFVWAASEHPDGNLRSVDAEDLAVAAGVSLSGAVTFTQALRKACTEDGYLLGWEYVGQPARDAAKDRERKAAKLAARDAEDVQRRAEGKEPFRLTAELLAAFKREWTTVYGGEMPEKKNVVDLRALCLNYGEAETLRRWGIMLRRVESRFANAGMLRRGWGEYSGAAKDAVSTSRRSATAFYDVLVKYGILTSPGMMDTLNKLEAEGTIKSASRFVELLRLCDRDLIRNARQSAYAIAHIEERIGSDGADVV